MYKDGRMSWCSKIFNSYKCFPKKISLNFFLKKCYDHVARLIITEILRHVDVIYDWLQRFSSLFLLIFFKFKVLLTVETAESPHGAPLFDLPYIQARYVNL